MKRRTTQPKEERPEERTDLKEKSVMVLVGRLAERLGTFALALLIGVVCWLRINTLEERLEIVQTDKFRLEQRLSNVITSDNTSVPSNLTMRLNTEVTKLNSEVDFLKRSRPNEEDYRVISQRLTRVEAIIERL
tara:strand:+ start:94 stop:495 length:402 start_codon:yes stop_codon:yes gene_type:complete